MPFLALPDIRILYSGIVDVKSRKFISPIQTNSIKREFIAKLFVASIQQTPNGPVLVLKESALQEKGRDAQKNNIMAAKMVCRYCKVKSWDHVD